MTNKRPSSILVAPNRSTIRTSPAQNLLRRLGTPHVNTQRHLAGRAPGAAKREMEKNATLLLSINYLKTLPRGHKCDFGDEIAQS